MKVNFTSLGCDKNLVDSEIMLGLMENNGHTLTDEPSEADVIIINTCGFILDATQEGIETILELSSYKKEGLCKSLIVTGCMATRYKDEIFKEMPEVDAVVGVSDYSAINDVINKTLTNSEKVYAVGDSNNDIDEDLYLQRVVTNQPHFSYLKIAEGCDNHCTYCTIPSIRGKFRSRSMDSLIKEATMLAEKGVKELVIIAQDTALYGTDIYGKQVLHELLQKLSEIKGIFWIRIMYCYPEHIYDELIEVMSKNDKIVKYIDMPIQHSNDKILKLMGRRSSEQELLSVIEKLRSNIPGIIIRTTLIVGFPHETDEEFNSLTNFIQKVEFDRLGVFTYSREEGTPADKMPNQVDEDIKEDRKNIIMDIQKNISAKKFNDFVGEIFYVLVDGKLEGEDVYVGRTYMDAIDVDGLVFFDCDYEIITGTICKVRVTSSSDYDLIGEIYNEFTE